MQVPDSLPAEERAPDSIQFNLEGMTEPQRRSFAEAAEAMGVKVQIFGLSTDNARAFWNWHFVPDLPEDLPATRAMLMRACDVRLPARLTRAECDFIAEALIAAAETVMGTPRAYGT